MHCRWGIVVATVVCIAVPAHAFQIESTVTGACHESITYAALEAEGWGRVLPPPLGEVPALSEDQRRAADDVPFRLVAGARNPWALALLIGVRSNDIRDNPSHHRERCVECGAGGADRLRSGIENNISGS